MFICYKKHIVLETSASSNGPGWAPKPCFLEVRAILLDVPLTKITRNHGFGNSCVCQCENTEIPAPERFCTLLRLPMDTELKNSENLTQDHAGPIFLLQNRTVLETSASSNGLGFASKPCFFEVPSDFARCTVHGRECSYLFQL